MLGVKHGMRLVEKLVDAGASVTVASAATKSTALHCAISSVFSKYVTPIEDLSEVLTFLISTGCDVDAIAEVDSCGMTPLSLLCSKVFAQEDVDIHRQVLFECAKALVNGGANLMMPSGRTPLNVLTGQLERVSDHLKTSEKEYQGKPSTIQYAKRRWACYSDAIQILDLIKDLVELICTVTPMNTVTLSWYYREYSREDIIELITYCKHVHKHRYLPQYGRCSIICTALRQGTKLHRVPIETYNIINNDANLSQDNKNEKLNKFDELSKKYVRYPPR